MYHFKRTRREEGDAVFLAIFTPPNGMIDRQKDGEKQTNKTKSIGVSEANYSCIWFLNGDIINSYQ